MTGFRTRPGGPALLTGVLLLWGCAGTGPAPIEGGPAGGGLAERSRIVILHDNDTHLHDNHRAETLAFIEGMRSRGVPVFLLSAGDIVVRHETGWPEGAGVEWYRERGLEMFARMNEFGYDLAVPGNHELFVHGTATREILESARFPMVAANIRIDTHALPRFAPYHVLETDDGRSLAVLGLSVINFEPHEGLEELDYGETVGQYLHLADEHDAMILLTHIGIRYEIELANRFPQLAAVIGGHTHTPLTEAIRVNGVLVAQTGGQSHREPDPEAGVLLGVVVLEFEGNELVDRCGWVLRIGPEGARPAGTYSGAGLGWEAEVPSC